MHKSQEYLDNSFILEELLKRINNSIADHHGKEILVSKGIAERVSIKGDSFIRSWLWDVPGFRRWRVTRMDAGNKIQVLNSVAYPDYINDQPILGIDLLWFGATNKLVAVLDFQPLIQDDDYFQKYYQGLGNLKNNFQEFNNEITMKIYDSNKFFSPFVLFYSGSAKTIKESLSNLFQNFIEYYWQLSESKLNTMNSEQVRKIHIEYDTYNAERDPAHGLFKSYFGKDWADNFVSNFLFPLSIKGIE